MIDDAYEGEVHVTIIATGFSQTFEDGLLGGRIPEPRAAVVSDRGGNGAGGGERSARGGAFRPAERAGGAIGGAWAPPAREEPAPAADEGAAGGGGAAGGSVADLLREIEAARRAGDGPAGGEERKGNSGRGRWPF